MEDWRPVIIEGFMLPNGEPRYEVSASGKVRWVGDEWDEKYGWLLRTHIMWGEPCVWLNKEKGVGRIWKVSDLVKLAFGKELKRRGLGVAKKSATKQSVSRKESTLSGTVAESAFSGSKVSEPAPKTKDCSEPVLVEHEIASSESTSVEAKSVSSDKVEKTTTKEDNVATGTSESIISMEELLERAKSRPKKDGRSSLAKRVRQWTKDGKLLVEYSSLKEASAETGVSYTAISACCHGRCKSAGGYGWSLAE